MKNEIANLKRALGTRDSGSDDGIGGKVGSRLVGRATEGSGLDDAPRLQQTRSKSSRDGSVLSPHDSDSNSERTRHEREQPSREQASGQESGEEAWRKMGIPPDLIKGLKDIVDSFRETSSETKPGLSGGSTSGSGRSPNERLKVPKTYLNNDAYVSELISKALRNGPPVQEAALRQMLDNWYRQQEAMRYLATTHPTWASQQQALYQAQASAPPSAENPAPLFSANTFVQPPPPYAPPNLPPAQMPFPMPPQMPSGVRVPGVGGLGVGPEQMYSAAKGWVQNVLPASLTSGPPQPIVNPLAAAQARAQNGEPQLTSLGVMNGPSDFSRSFYK